MNKAYFENKVCVITGASTGIGYGLAGKLLELGATVYMVARTKAKLAEALESYKAYAGKVHIQACDVSDHDAVRQLMTTSLAGRVTSTSCSTTRASAPPVSPSAPPSRRGSVSLTPTCGA